MDKTIFYSADAADEDYSFACSTYGEDSPQARAAYDARAIAFAEADAALGWAYNPSDVTLYSQCHDAD